MKIVTLVSAHVDEDSAQELVAAFEALLAVGLPDGLLRTELLGDGNGSWVISSTWRDQDALDAMRAAPAPPAAPALFRRFKADPTLTVMRVVVGSAE
ncbi:antibiotic biosynthesis monooxygenase [Pedococcus sp. NPDC057267]|uniref:antibiotic biosynthesis monooxygenase n=1 Tax=Pedococcus sp. NPDC057267 TaxID=3346077 RepID=UPI00362BB1DC